MVNIWTGFVTADSGWVTVTLRNVQNLNSPIKKILVMEKPEF